MRQMRVCSAALVTFAALVLGAIPARATIALPAATGSVQCETPAGSIITASASCSTASDNASVTDAPFAGASAYASYPGGFASVSASALSQLAYDFEITGPSSTVQLDIGVDLQQVPTANGITLAGITVGVDGTIVIGKAICSSGGLCGDFTEAFNGVLDIDAEVGAIYSIQLTAEAGGPFGTTANSGTASADPHLFIDPSVSNASSYTIELSPGISNDLPSTAVPEPSSLSLLAVSFIFLVVGWRRSVSAPHG